MAKREKTLRVLIRRGSDVRELLQVSRMSDGVYQATAPGEQGHRSYKESGRLQTKFKVQGASHARDWYGDISDIPSPDELEDAVVLNTFVIGNEGIWFDNPASPLKKYSGHQADAIVEIDSAQLPESCELGIAVGVIGKSRDTALDAHSLSMCGDVFEEMRRVILPTKGAALFCLVVRLKDGLDVNKLPSGARRGIGGARTSGTAARYSGSHKMHHGQSFAILSAKPIFGSNPDSPYSVAAGSRLAMCMCKSGRRFKHCHGRADAFPKSVVLWTSPTLTFFLTNEED